MAAAAEEAWGQGAAAAVASLRLAEARLVMATDPRAALPALQRAAELAEGWGWPTIVLAASAHLAAAQWAVGDRAGAASASTERRMSPLPARPGPSWFAGSKSWKHGSDGPPRRRRTPRER